MANEFQSLRGMPDVLPDEQAASDHVVAIFQRLAAAAGYRHLDPPMLEEVGVFVRGVGTGTDVVDKEMYVFEDRSGKQIALRPEPTAGVVRAYIQNGMASWPQPVRLQIAGPMFRYDRPQAGRRRQFHQVGVEVLGEQAPSVDAQIIALAMRFYRAVGLRNVMVQINSIGDASDRKTYLAALVEYLNQHKAALAEIDRERLETNPLRVLDSKDPGTQKVVAAAPKVLDYLSDSSKAHFTQVTEYLDALKIRYEINHLLVRGLDYYTHTVFEFYGDREGGQSSLGGGGRYDRLVEQLGGKSTPAAGFGIGIERVLLELELANATPQTAVAPTLYMAALGEPARLTAFTMIEQLLDAGVSAIGSVDKDGLGGQLERANRMGVSHAVIIGQKEVQEHAVILRDMKSGEQETIPLKTAVSVLQKRFA